MRDITFYIDENIRDVGNAGHVARFVSIFTHFGKVSIKDTEQQLSFEKSDGETKSKVGRLISQFQEFAKASFK